MREKWSDERLNDLNRRVENGFNRVDADLRDVRGEIAGLRSGMDARFEHLESRFDALQRTMLQVGGGLVAALLGVMVTLIALIVTQV